MSGVHVPARRDTGLLTTVMKGVQIARDIYGMKIDADQLEMQQQAAERAGQESEQRAENDKQTASERKRLVDARIASMNRAPEAKAPETKQVGDALVERQADGSWKQVYLKPPKSGGLAPPGAAPSGTAVAGAPADYGKKVGELNASERQRLDSAAMGLDAVVGMRDGLAAGDWTFRPFGDNDFTRNRRKFEEALGRMQSGGAINDDERAAFAKMAPTATDSAEQQQKKMQDLYTEMSFRVKNLGFEPDEILAARRGAGGGMAPIPKDGEAIAAPQGKAPLPTPEDTQALQWLMANPKDPNAAAVRAALQAKGMIE